MNIYSECFIFCQISFLKYLDLLKICSKKDSFYEYSYITFSFGFFKYIPETYQFLQRSYKILKHLPLNPHRCADATAGSSSPHFAFPDDFKAEYNGAAGSYKRQSSLHFVKTSSHTLRFIYPISATQHLFSTQKTGREFFPACLKFILAFMPARSS